MYTEDNPKILLKNILACSKGNIIFFAAQICRNLLIARILGPLFFGAWNLGLVFFLYGQSSQFGILNAFRLDGARLLGAKKDEEYKKIQRLTWTAMISVAIIITILVIIKSFFSRDLLLKIPLYVLVFNILPFMWYQFSISSLTVSEKFTISSRVQIVFALSNLLLTLLFGLKWKIWGILIAQPISYGISLYFLRKKASLFFVPFFEKRLFIKEMKIGFPIWLNGLIYTLFITLDRTIIPIRLGLEALGLYSLTSMARSSFGLIPSSVSEVVYMRGATEYGASGQKSPPLSLLLRTNLLMAYLLALPLGLSILWAPLGIKLLLPSFLPGLHALQFFLLGLFFIFPTNGGTLLIIIDKAKEASVLLGIVSIIQIILIFIGMNVGGITGVSVACGMSSLLLFAFLNWWGFRRFLGDFNTIKHMFYCILPWIWMVILFFAMYFIKPHLFQHLEKIKNAIIASSLSIIVLAPMIFLSLKLMKKRGFVSQ